MGKGKGMGKMMAVGPGPWSQWVPWQAGEDFRLLRQEILTCRVFRRCFLAVKSILFAEQIARKMSFRGEILGERNIKTKLSEGTGKREIPTFSTSSL